MSLVIMLPFPPRELQPNVHLNRWTKAQFQRSYKDSCWVDAKNAKRVAEAQGMTFPLTVPVSARITFVLTNKRRRDYDNLIASLKHGIDGLVLAGVLSDDNVFALKTSYDVELGKKAGVRVELS